MLPTTVQKGYSVARNKVWAGGAGFCTVEDSKGSAKGRRGEPTNQVRITRGEEVGRGSIMCCPSITGRDAWKKILARKKGNASFQRAGSLPGSEMGRWT